MRFWDFLFFFLVLIPLFTGGLWWRQKGLSLEITQPGPALAALAVWAYFLHRAGRDVWTESRSLRFVSGIWRRWRQLLHTHPEATITCATLFVGTIWFFAAFARHHSLNSGAADLGIFTNALWNLVTAGELFASLKNEASLLIDHQSFILFPISYVFKLHPSPEILLALQAFVLAAGGAALYLLATQRLSKDHAFVALVPVLYWLYPHVRTTNLFDFHPEALMLPLFLFAVWGIQHPAKGFRWLGVVLFLLAASAKESGGPTAAGIGLAWFAGMAPESERKRTRILGLAAIAFGFLLFWFDMKKLPEILGYKYYYGGLYDPFGTGLIDLALAPFRHTNEFFSRIFGFYRLKFFFSMIGPLALLPLLAPISLIATIPGFLMLFLAQGDQRLSLGFHYTTEPSVGVFLALVSALTLTILQKHESKVIVGAILASMLFFGRGELYQIRHFRAAPHAAWVRDHVLPEVRDDSSVSASSALVPHLSLRKSIYFLPFMRIKNADLVDCVLHEGSVSNAFVSASDVEPMETTLRGSFDLEYSCRSLRVFRRKGQAKSCLYEAPTCS